MLRTFDVASLVAQRRPLLQHDDEEPSEPDALTTPQMADAIHSVVPVAGADERQSVRAVLQRAIDRANRMVVDGCGFTGDRRLSIHLPLIRFERRRLEK